MFISPYAALPSPEKLLYYLSDATETCARHRAQGPREEVLRIFKVCCQHSALNMPQYPRPPPTPPPLLQCWDYSVDCPALTPGLCPCLMPFSRILQELIKAPSLTYLSFEYGPCHNQKVHCISFNWQLKFVVQLHHVNSITPGRAQEVKKTHRAQEACECFKIHTPTSNPPGEYE